MKCPNCNEPLDREDAYRMVHSSTGELEQLTPTSDYHCDNCGSDYEWKRGKGLAPMFDSRSQEYGLTR